MVENYKKMKVDLAFLVSDTVHSDILSSRLNTSMATKESVEKMEREGNTNRRCSIPDTRQVDSRAR